MPKWNDCIFADYHDLGTKEACAKLQLSLNRMRWIAEYKNHRIRDMTFSEDTYLIRAEYGLFKSAFLSPIELTVTFPHYPDDVS